MYPYTKHVSGSLIPFVSACTQHASYATHLPCYWYPQHNFSIHCSNHLCVIAVTHVLCLFMFHCNMWKCLVCQAKPSTTAGTAPPSHHQRNTHHSAFAHKPVDQSLRGTGDIARALVPAVGSKLAWRPPAYLTPSEVTAAARQPFLAAPPAVTVEPVVPFSAKPPDLSAGNSNTQSAALSSSGTLVNLGHPYAAAGMSQGSAASAQAAVRHAIGSSDDAVEKMQLRAVSPDGAVASPEGAVLSPNGASVSPEGAEWHDASLPLADKEGAGMESGTHLELPIANRSQLAVTLDVDLMDNAAMQLAVERALVNIIDGCCDSGGKLQQAQLQATCMKEQTLQMGLKMQL